MEGIKEWEEKVSSSQICFKNSMVFDTTHLTIKLLILDCGLICDECMKVCL